MFGLHARQLRTLIATLCVALGALLSVQFATATVDRIEHRLGLQHVASAVAGPVIFDHDDADHHAEHTQAVATDNDGLDATPHHHHGDGPQLVILVNDAADGIVTFRALDPALGQSTAPPSSSPGGLDRPPRADTERFA